MYVIASVVGGGCTRGEMDGLRESGLLRAPKHSGRGARARVRARQCASAPARAAEGETSGSVDAGLRQYHSKSL